jgi:hypothetical protein
MISQKLVHLIRDHSEELYLRWLRELKQHPDTQTYHKFPEEQLRERVLNVYVQLTRSLTGESSRADIERIYRHLGAERFREGFKVSEVVKAFILTRRILMDFLQHHGLLDSAAELYQVLDLYGSVLLFFDRIMHFTIKGYEEQIHLHKSLSH